MPKANKPIVWLPFAAGGALAAFLLPAVMLAALLASLGLWPQESFAFERMRAFADHLLVKPALLVALGLPLWHAAHRLRMTLQDLGLRGPRTRRWSARLCYATAAAATLTLFYTIWP